MPLNATSAYWQTISKETPPDPTERTAATQWRSATSARDGTMVGMKAVRSPKHDIDELRRKGDPRLTDADKDILRDLARGPKLALELAALESHDPELAG